MLGHANLPPVKTRQAGQLVQVKAFLRLPQNRSPPDKSLAALRHLSLPFQQAKVAHKALLALAQDSLDWFIKISIL